MGFDVIDEKGKMKLGNIITVFKIDGIDREFVLFSIEGIDDEDDMASLLVTYLNKTDDGYSYIEEITDKKVYKQAMDVVKDMFNIIKTK